MIIILQYIINCNNYCIVFLPRGFLLPVGDYVQHFSLFLKTKQKASKTVLFFFVEAQSPKEFQTTKLTQGHSEIIAFNSGECKPNFELGSWSFVISVTAHDDTCK